MQERIPSRERAAWDAAYSRTGRRYGGAPPALPPLFEGARVLEAGCGDGKTLLAMAGRGWEIAGMDLSSEAIRIASGHRALREVEFLLGDATAMPFAPESFDAVFLFHVLGHIPDEARPLAASGAERVLARGGTLYLRVFSVRDFREGRGRPAGPHTYERGDGIRTHYFTPGEVRALFSLLTPSLVRTVEWSLRVRGVDLTRSEIVAEFRKE